MWHQNYRCLESKRGVKITDIKKIVGYTQVVLGMVLIISTILLRKVAVDNYVGYINNFQEEICSKFYSESKLSEKEFSEEIQKSATSIGNFYTVLFGTCALIIILSLLMIFLGILNIHSEHGRDIPDRDILKGFFIVAVIVIITYVVLRILLF